MTTLKPRQPPGNAKRRARAFCLQIVDLQAQGYSLEAIREALADAGVAVSKSTVQREAVVGRKLKAQGVAPSPVAAAASHDTEDGVSCAPQSPQDAKGAQSQAAKAPTGAAGDSPSKGEKPATASSNSSRQAAAEFVGAVITNPLMKRGRQ